MSDERKDAAESTTSAPASDSAAPATVRTDEGPDTEPVATPENDASQTSAEPTTETKSTSATKPVEDDDDDDDHDDAEPAELTPPPTDAQHPLPGEEPQVTEVTADSDPEPVDGEVVSDSRD